MEQQLISPGRQIDILRIALWSGTTDSAFLAEQWVKMIDKAKGPQARNWNNDIKMSYVFNALRGDAAMWFNPILTLRYNTTV